MSSQYTISHVQVQSEHHIFCSSPVRTLPRLPMSGPVTMPPKTLCPCPVSIPPFLHWYPCTVNTLPLMPMSNQSPYILPMSSQFITSPTHIQLEYHLSYSRLVNTPYLLPSSSQNTIFSIHVQSLHYRSCKVPLVTIFPSQVQSVHHLSYPYQVRIPHIKAQYVIFNSNQK